MRDSLLPGIRARCVRPPFCCWRISRPPRQRIAPFQGTWHILATAPADLPLEGPLVGPGDSCGTLLQQSRAGRPLEQHVAAGSGMERWVQIDQVNKGIANLLAQNRQVVAVMQMVAHRRVVPLVSTGPRHARGRVAKSLTRATVRDDRRAGQPAICMVSLGCGKARG
jgi:hypothetical protein